MHLLTIFSNLFCLHATIKEMFTKKGVVVTSVGCVGRVQGAGGGGYGQKKNPVGTAKLRAGLSKTSAGRRSIRGRKRLTRTRR